MDFIIYYIYCMYIKCPTSVVFKTQRSLVKKCKARRMSDVMVHTYLRERDVNDGNTRKKT